MRINTLAHGLLDYLFGVLLTASPWLFAYSNDNAATHIATTLGMGVLLYSSVTNYELGIVRLFPFYVHLFFDLVLGVLLLGARWHFDLHGKPALVFLIFGVFSIVVVFFSQRTPRKVGTI